MRRGTSIGRMLVGLNAFVLLVPVLALVLLQIYESHLVEQTERRLLGEAAVVGEAYRQFLLEERHTSIAPTADILPANHHRDAIFWVVHPVIDISKGHSPPAPAPTTRTAPASPDTLAAGIRLKSMLDRVKRLNLSSVRVVDASGCLVASTSSESSDVCVGNYPEVRQALAGKYSAVARERHTSRNIATSIATRPDPISRHGDTRVFVALPIFYNGDVIGVVRMARTSLNTVEALWRHRGTLLWAGLACLLLTLGISWYLTRAIGRPMGVIAEAARDIAAGKPRRLSPKGTVPAEVADMSASLDAMTEQLSRRAQYIQEFATTASHELKTPITGIRGATELLLESWDEMSTDQRQRFLGNIDADAARMEAVVSRLLALARIENASGSADDGAEPFDAAEVARELVPSGVEVRADGVALVTMRREHYETALRSLLDNALEHGAKPVEVVIASDADRVAIEVRDHGSGVSEGNVDRIFERFFTTRRDEGGTGLGLAIALAIAERRGGSLTYARSEGVTAFTLRL